MKSIWNDEVQIEQRPQLIGNVETEVAVIGGGMAGILTAYFLMQEGKDVVVLEAERIAGGQTKNTTAKITSQHGLCYDKMVRNMGRQRAWLYAQANEEAITSYEELIQKHQISCEFKRVSSYLYSTTEDQKLRNEAVTATDLGILAEFTEKTELPFLVKGAVRFDRQAQFHPLLFLKELSKEITIYEHTRVIAVKKHTLYTEMATVHAEHIVFATHYPFIDRMGWYFMRQHQERSYVLALKNAQEYRGMYYGIDKGGLSFRSAGDILLLGGGAHRTGEASKQYSYEYLRKKTQEYFPQAEEISHWSAQDCISHDRLPFIGRYSYWSPHWYVATGFHKWGMTLSMLAAKVLTAYICGREHPYEKIVSPRRFCFRASVPELWIDMGVSVKYLAKGGFHIPLRKCSDLEAGQGRIARIGWKRYGVYADQEGIMHKVSVRCPHLGCEMQWNQNENTFDCPCHGSRIGMNGKILDGPAQR